MLSVARQVWMRLAWGGDGLCTVLLAAYDGVQLGSKDVSGLEKSCVVSALSSLLAVSHSAKHTALQGR